MLARLPERERAALLECARPVAFPRGSFLYHEGQPGQSLYIVSSGRVGVWSGGERGAPILVATMGPGDVVGEMAVIGSEHVRTASVQAMTDVRAVQFDGRDIEAILARQPRAYVLFVDLLIARVQRLNAQLAEYVEVDGATRIHRQLCAIADTGEQLAATTTLPLAQHHLASLAGVSLRLASGVLTRSRRDGLLRTSRGEITILDWPGVRRRAGLPLNGRPSR